MIWEFELSHCGLLNVAHVGLVDMHVPPEQTCGALVGVTKSWVAFLCETLQHGTKL